MRSGRVDEDDGKAYKEMKGMKSYEERVGCGIVWFSGER